MRFAAGLSDAVNVRTAAERACREVLDRLEGAPCHAAFVFASTAYRTAWPAVAADICDRLRPRVLIGCSGSGIIGGDQELEWVPALSIVGAHLPDVRLFPFSVSPEELEQSSAGGFWIDKIGVAPDAKPVFVTCVDPFTCDPNKLLQELNATYRSRPIVGGLVSGGTQPGDHFLFMDAEVSQKGAVGLAMAGNIAMDTVVSQGCRPVGRPYVVTKADEHIIWELAGRQAVDVLHEVLTVMTPEDRELAQRGSIFVGLVINEMRSAFSPGDFLIRNIVGLDPQAGALGISGDAQVGQTLQFHLRDAGTSRDELRRVLAARQSSIGTPAPAGALFFNCSGRGRSLYGTPHHDIQTIRAVAGQLPLGGFFCNGEIGPVGGTNFLHGYTASLGLFHPLARPAQPPQPANTASRTA